MDHANLHSATGRARLHRGPSTLGRTERITVRRVVKPSTSTAKGAIIIIMSHSRRAGTHGRRAPKPVHPCSRAISRESFQPSMGGQNFFKICKPCYASGDPYDA